MQESSNKLMLFLKNEYMGVHGAGDVGNAIRDCLTDLVHINDTLSESEYRHMTDRLESAMSVAKEENEIAKETCNGSCESCKSCEE